MFKMGANIIDKENYIFEFNVFAFNKKNVSLITNNGEQREFPMKEVEPHIYHTTIQGSGLDFLYKYKISGEGEFPDPYSNFQPHGVHGFSQVVDHSSYKWNDSYWKGKKHEELIIMEVHVGSFTQEGTFKAAAKKLDHLIDLGVNAIELMPLTQTPGRWNWGYDATNLFSVNHNYGTPEDLKELIDNCHTKNIAVILDVVYNHFGPEGNYLSVYGPYFTSKHKTPWGPAVNFDDNYSSYTRQMVLDSVEHWLTNYHFDGLRLDAVHAIKDNSSPHILQEISELVHKLSSKQNRKLFVIAESDENDKNLITPVAQGGLGMDAQWMDDFHHTIHTVLTGEREGYYIDYGEIKHMEKVFKNFLYTGEYSRYWNKPRGTDASDFPGKRFVVCIQNHDQVGNRAGGERLSLLVDFPYLKVAAGLLFYSPYIPLIFMGEEYGEKNPFLFFTDYQDPELKQAVSKGRKEEFSKFTWKNVPDPQDPKTFFKSKLTPKSQWTEQNQHMFNFYKDLIKLRLNHPVLKKLDKNNLEVKVFESEKLVKITRWDDKQKLIGFFNMGGKTVPFQQNKKAVEIFNSSRKIYGEEKNSTPGVLKKGQMVILELND